ncbi:STP1 protein [Plasmodium ovale curtisi]|uniref:STP1 protein n=1 Tax=Plasmodium ovale curtisi TaxID=864141 RepID=A0A1A8WQI0_PLAOA|nr:STP1 protein [Plasmodium ovale curtisi]
MMGMPTMYSTDLREIPISTFVNMIRSDVENLIHRYGHKKCGLMHKELCDDIDVIINTKKRTVLSGKDRNIKNNFNDIWSGQRKKIFDNIFQEIGFQNICYPRTLTYNPKLHNLKKVYVSFCKEIDERKSNQKINTDFDECTAYNNWVDREKLKFQREYLKKVAELKLPNVLKYLNHTENYKTFDPVKTYYSNKKNCILVKKKQEQPRISSTHANPPISKSTETHSRGKATESQNKKPSPKHTGLDSKKKDVLQTHHSVLQNGHLKITPITIKTTDKPSIQNTDTPHTDAISPTKSQSSTKLLHFPHPISPILPVPSPKQPLPAFHSLPTEESEKSGVSQITPLTQPTSPQTETKTATTPNRNPPGDPVAPTAIVPQFQPPRSLESVIKARTSYTSSNPTLTSDPTINVDSPLPVTKGQDGATYSIPRTNSITSATTNSSQYVSTSLDPDLSLSQRKTPALNVDTAEGHITIAAPSTITVTTTTTAIAPVTISTMSTTQASIPPTQVPSVSGSQEPSPSLAAGEPKATVPITENQQTVTSTPTPLSGSNTEGVSVPTQTVTDDGSKQTSLSREPSSEHKDTRPKPGAQLTNDISQTSGQKPDKVVVAADDKLLRTIDQTDPMRNISTDQTGISRDHDQLIPHINAYPGKIPNVKSENDLTNNLVTQKGKNDKLNIMSEGIPPLMHIIPNLLVILATITLLFQLYKYTPFGFLLGRRRKRKKQDLRRIFEIPEKSAYESPNITVHEWEDHNLGSKTVENDAYIKLFKINRYKQEMQKSKKKNKTTLIEVHMEVLEDYKSAEWELHKGDFLEICLRGFINEENDTYQNFSNSELIVNNIKNEKTIEDIQKQDILWNNWIENHRNILEQWKKEAWFQILKNKWRNEQQIYKEKNNKLQENILNEKETHSIVSQKDIWKRWISKQATLIDTFNEEDWFKSIVCVQDKEKDNYPINEYNNISVTSTIGLKNEKMNHEHGRSKNIKQKLMVQIHMMVLEECIKEDIIKHKELCIDNFIEDIHNQNNYDEKKYIPQCDTDDFDVPEYEEIHTSINK